MIVISSYTDVLAAEHDITRGLSVLLLQELKQIFLIPQT